MILIILLSFCGPLQAEEGSVPVEQVPGNADNSRETSEQKSPAATVVWPPPFKPSEEIGADSQISFPTDI